MRKSLWIAGSVIVGLVVVGGVASNGEETQSTPAPTSTPTVSAEPEQSQADKFKAFVKDNGTANEKAAVKHVTKVQGASEQNDVLDTPEIHTDYTGGMAGPHTGDGKLLASAFAEWKSSENGLVTVYDTEGEILANGQF